ncbi:hypothetical protein [Corynebacterium aurimucosum]|uniref:Uncharacterized protein n=1 Tax=Corynebacterium aurimucosum (strain ATCC 700975 / DSM 44827 / CIP 107346 / CN-1) TaxID=548476 RepID=C3PI62_CORA7|nr:hypothetical protein [Corynebacterium aurimucosum]ACP33516.1 hypothetical protein cauri_1923 [Corynebacterium aurimucosum ATCC 700975]QQU92373.1 hypothetical protein I6I67_09010 [Corynebacterium aurimucosum]
MARQMRTTEKHHTTEDYQVVTQTGFINDERVYQIAVINRNTGREEHRDVDSVENAIRLCNNSQDYLDKQRAELATKREVEAKGEEERAEDAATKAIGPLATDRQVDYIMALLAQHGGQNTTWFSAGPTTLEEVANMTRRDASTYISALKGDN